MRHSALNNVMEISNYSIEEAYVLSNYNVEKKGKLTYYPIYMIMFIEEEKAVFPVVDFTDLTSIKINE